MAILRSILATQVILMQRVLLASIIAFTAIALTAIVLDYTGLVKVACSQSGCEFLIQQGG